MKKWKYFSLNYEVKISTRQTCPKFILYTSGETTTQICHKTINHMQCLLPYCIISNKKAKVKLMTHYEKVKAGRKANILVNLIEDGNSDSKPTLAYLTRSAVKL